MDFSLVLSVIDQIGVAVFAISGAVVAVRKQMDIFGVIFLAYLPAIGGGTLRDLLLDQPVFWLTDPVSMGLVVLAAMAVFFLYPLVENLKPLRWADAVGLSLFAVTGAAKAMDLGHNFIVVGVMGMLTACAGGLLRDMVANDEPLLLRADIYATAALAGALLYYGAVCVSAPEPWPVLAGMCGAFALRCSGIIWSISLPKSPHS